MVEKTGLQAVFETADFQKGLDIYKRGLTDAQSATGQSAQGISSAGSMVGGLTSALGGISPVAMIAGGALLQLGSTILSSVVDAFKQGIEAAKQFTVESIYLASRWSELDMVAQLMGQRIGMTSEEVHALTQEMQDAGIRADVASNAISQFIRMEMNPNLALGLGEVAQDLAVIAEGGADSSETLNNLMLGIQRLSPIILRTAGVNVDLEQSYAKFAETAGIVGRELTQVEKQQAAYNAVLEEGAKVAGAYDIAMESAGKQMRSLTGREIPTLQAAFGAPFQGAFLNVAKAMRTVVSTITDAISEGGALYPVMVKLGAIADIVTEALASLATKGTAAVVNFLSGLSSTFGNSAQSAFDWGFELVTNFAQGIIDAAASVLVTAINYLGSILAGWLAPGSPPKVAPDIIKWGIGAMTEYLHGFTQADFGILKDIQNPLKSALDIFVQQGELTKKEAAQTLLSLNEELAKALSSGTADESLFERIANEAGEFGKEIAQLARDEFALAQATDDVAAAQEAVNAAMEKQANADKAVRDLTDEYNRLLRAGASDEVLKAQLAQINAAEEQAILAGEEVEAAEDGLAEKEAALDILKEQVALQKDLVNQLLELARMAIVPSLDGVGGGGGVGVPGGGGAGAGFEVDTDAIKNKMKEAIDKAVTDMKARWSAYWGAFRAIMLTKLALVKASLITALEGHGGVILQKWEEFKTTVADALDWIRNEIVEWGLYFEGWWQDHGAAVQSIIQSSWDIITGIYNTGMSGLGVIIESFAPVLLGLFTTMMSGLGIIAAVGYETLKGIFKTGFEGLGIEVDIFAALLEGDWDAIEEMTIAAWTGLWNAIKETFNTAITTIRVKYVSKFFGIGKDIVQGLIDGVKSLGQSFINHLIGLISAAINAVLEKLVEHSPSMVFFNIGANTMKGMILGVDSMLGDTMRTMNDAMNDIIGASNPSTSIIQPSSTRIMNVNQQNNIQSPMDLATFQAMFNQVVRMQFQGT